MHTFYCYDMGGLSRSVFVRATGMLCLLGIGIGLGTVLLFHLIRHCLRRKPSLPSTDGGDDPRPLPTSDARAVPIQEKAGDENAYDEVSSIVSLSESGFDCTSNSDFDFDNELTTSIRSDDDSVDSAPELQRQAGDEAGVGEHRAKLRRRRFGIVKETGVVNLESGNTDSISHAINSRLLGDIDSKSDNDCALPTELRRDASFSSEQQQGLVEPGDVDAQLSSTSLNRSSFSMVNRSYMADLMLRNDVASPNRTFLSDTVENFDHSTPDERTSASWMPRGRWTLAQSNFTVDCDVAPGKSVSYHDCCRDFPTASRSCMSIDLGEMSSISSYVSEMVDEGKLDCNAMNNMEMIEVELNNIQVEMREMEKRVGKLQVCGISQKYNICPVDFSMDSVDDNFEVLPSPRRSSLCNLHQMSVIEPEASLVWDYDFDVEVGSETFDLKSSLDVDDESLGQLESFVRYRSQKVARDAFRRSSLAMSDAASHLNRSDSLFSCLTPSYSDDTDQKSCSLYDVNRRLAGQFVIPGVSGNCQLPRKFQAD